jgi:hypothetical protein
MSGSRWVAEFPITMVLESPRDLIALARAVARATARLGNAAPRRAVAAGCAQYDALGGEASSAMTVTEPGRAGQDQGPAAGEPGVVTWAGSRSLGVAGRGELISTGVAGRGALFSDPERPCQPWSGYY